MKVLSESWGEGLCPWPPFCMRSFDVRGISKIGYIQHQPANRQSVESEPPSSLGVQCLGCGSGLWIVAVDPGRGPVWGSRCWDRPWLEAEGGGFPACHQGHMNAQGQPGGHSPHCSGSREGDLLCTPAPPPIH